MYAVSGADVLIIVVRSVVLEGCRVEKGVRANLFAEIVRPYVYVDVAVHLDD